MQLDVAYQSQRDAAGKAADYWWHMCNSSCHAMLIDFLKPGLISDPAHDAGMAIDDYYLNEFVTPFGDSEDHNVHTAALQELGIESYWSQELSYADIDRSLAVGIPMPIGVLHRGSVWAPEGGHIILAIGKDGEGYRFNDPWGYGFAYSDQNGANVFYPKKPSLNNRWLVDGPNAGWGRIITAIDGVKTGLE